LSPELRKYYENRLSMMGSTAWKDLMDDIQEMLSATNTLDSVPDEKTLHYKKGEVSIMRWMLSLKSISEESYEGLQNAADV